MSALYAIEFFENDHMKDSSNALFLFFFLFFQILDLHQVWWNFFWTNTFYTKKHTHTHILQFFLLGFTK
jgi:predicted ABC-type exoprotein transport system permease subunit